MSKICIASSGLGHVARGIEAWADDLGHALAARGEDIILCKGGGQRTVEFERVVPCWNRESIKTRALLRCMPRSIGWRIGVGSGYEIEQTTFARNLVKVLRDEDADLLHVQDPYIALLVQQARRRGVIRTRTILGHGTEEPLEFQAKITYLQHLAPWHAREAYQAGVFRDTWTTLPNFVDTDRYCPGSSDSLRRELRLAADEVVVLAASAIKRHHKRIDYLAKEFRILLDRHPDLKACLVVAGGWEATTDDVIAGAKRLLGDRVRFLIRFPRRRMAELYRAADLFTLASLKEMMPMALLEASASGLPCVVHHHPVMQWMVGPGGVTADLSREGGWADIAAPLLHDARQRVELGQRARQHCQQNFSAEVVVSKILVYYDWVLHHDSPGSRGRTCARPGATVK